MDDDPAVHMMLEAKLKQRFSGLSIVTSTEPKPYDGFDVYILDNDFNGIEACADAAERARIANPEGLILAYSSHLNIPTLKRLVSGGCDAAFEKGRADELENLINAVGSHLGGVRPGYGGARFPQSSAGLVRELTDLVASWRDRLSYLERNA
jgi:hypothetical protein